MRPKRIILVRHGESEGNTDKSIYGSTPDHAIGLTEYGVRQAQDAGAQIKQIVGKESVHAYMSPYLRARLTFYSIAEHVNCEKAYEEPRLREQEWGHFREMGETARIEAERKKYGYFFYRFPDGESGADVYDRITTFLETLHRDFAKEDYAQNTLLVTHGLTMRLFVMRWFHLPIADFETWRNPKNCQIAVMTKKENNKYDLSLLRPGSTIVCSNSFERY